MPYYITADNFMAVEHNVQITFYKVCLQTAILGKWLLSNLVIWKIIKINVTKDKNAPIGKVVKSKFSLFYLRFSLTFHTKRTEPSQYFPLSSTWYLTETSTMQMNSERDELWKRWGVLRATDFENHQLSLKSNARIISETSGNSLTCSLRVHELLKSVFPPQQRVRGSQNLPDPFLTLHHSKKKGGMTVKCSLPYSLYASLAQACFLSPLLSSRLHSIT